MATTAKERYEVIDRLSKLGITYNDASALRRIAMTLHTWHERECGVDNGCIGRDEQTNKPYWLDSTTMHRAPIADKETGALKRLKTLMKQYSNLTYYVQTDPRGASLFILRKELTTDYPLDQIYTRGVAVY